MTERTNNIIRYDVAVEAFHDWNDKPLEEIPEYIRIVEDNGFVDLECRSFFETRPREKWNIENLGDYMVLHQKNIKIEEE